MVTQTCCTIRESDGVSVLHIKPFFLPVEILKWDALIRHETVPWSRKDTVHDILHTDSRPGPYTSGSSGACVSSVDSVSGPEKGVVALPSAPLESGLYTAPLEYKKTLPAASAQIMSSVPFPIYFIDCICRACRI